MLARGENIASIAMTIRIMNIVKDMSGKHDLDNGSQLMLLALANDEFKRAYLERYGDDAYRKDVERYSVSNIQKQATKQRKEAEKDAQRQATEPD